MKVSHFLFSCLVFLAAWAPPLHGIFGKVEIAPAYAHIDLIQAKKTVQELDLVGVRGEVSVSLLGYYLKPQGIYAKGKHCELTSAGMSFGRCIPVIADRLLVSTQIGASYTLLKATSKEFDNFRQHFEGWAPFVGGELVLTVCKGVRLSGSMQYSWNRSHLRVKHFIRAKDYKENGRGPTYNAMLEYDLNACWSINLAGTYNESFAREKGKEKKIGKKKKEKNGIRGKGCKLGLAFWF